MESPNAGGVDGGPEAPGPPPLLKRLIDTVFSPDQMARAVAEHPKWVAALLLAAALLALQIALIPADILASVQRQAMLDAGRDMPEMGETALLVVRIVGPIAAAVSIIVFTCLFAGLYTLIFAFILGDEGKYRQYLAVLAHASIIPALIGLLLTPLRISTENPQLTVNVGSFLFFMDDGYWLGVFTAMDLSQIWAALVMAQGVHMIDPRRSFRSAAIVLLGFVVVLALIFGRFL